MKKKKGPLTRKVQWSKMNDDIQLQEAYLQQLFLAMGFHNGSKEDFLELAECVKELYKENRNGEDVNNVLRKYEILDLMYKYKAFENEDDEELFLSNVYE